MSWRRAGFISEQLTAVLIPLCVYGMLAALILHLIDLRAVFIAGGEAKLRQAALAFASLIVLLERLAYMEGPSVARAYKWATAITITLFALYYADAYRLPAPVFVVFAATEAIFIALWWCGHHLSAACAVSDDKVVAEAAEGGALRGLRFWRQRATAGAPPQVEAPDEGWTARLSTRHPGRVLLYFSLVALPLFGAGLLLFDDDNPAKARLGLTLFLYLWCALALLFLSSLRQLTVYFRRRELSLPDLIGIPWMALGFLGVTLALALAFVLPQPPSPLGLPVRGQIVATYKGRESRHGQRDAAKPATPESKGAGSGKGWSRDNIRELEQRHQNLDRLNDPELSRATRNSGAEPEARGAAALSAAVNDTISDSLQLVMRVLLGLGAVGAALVALITAAVFAKRLREGAGESWDRMKKLLLREAKKRPPERPARRLFPGFTDPFRDPALAGEPNRLIRHLWEATLAFCHDAGEPCSPDLTPLEFIESAPEALRGFEERARFIARVFTFSEFSSQPVPEASPAELQRVWQDLQRHAAGL